jgi:hypothetical protein
MATLDERLEQDAHKVHSYPSFSHRAVSAQDLIDTSTLWTLDHASWSYNWSSAVLEHLVRTKRAEVYIGLEGVPTRYHIKWK